MMLPESVFADKIVLITGGTGSFGKEFARRLLLEDACHKVIIFSRDEWKQWEIQQSDPIFRRDKIRFFLGDVRDTSRLKLAFDQVDYIVHTAVLKQIYATEYNPSETIKTNINGSMNVIDIAIEQGVKKVIYLSSDKAVNATSLYGTTKACAEKLFITANGYTGAKRDPRLSIVRFGSILDGCSGVLTLWKNLLSQGAKELPLTDVRMSRFWITLTQAVDFVIRALTEMAGGEIFVPKLPSIKVADIGAVVAPHTPLSITGIRPGEKLQEILISNDEAQHTVDCTDYYIVVPQFMAQDQAQIKKFLAGRGRNFVPEKFSYGSEATEAGVRQHIEWLKSL